MFVYEIFFLWNSLKEQNSENLNYDYNELILHVGQLKRILSYFYQLGSMRSMISQVSGRTGSRSSSDERTKAHESQLYTEVRMRTSF